MGVVWVCEQVGGGVSVYTPQGSPLPGKQVEVLCRAGVQASQGPARAWTHIHTGKWKTVIPAFKLPLPNRVPVSFPDHSRVLGRRLSQPLPKTCDPFAALSMAFIGVTSLGHDSRNTLSKSPYHS